MQQLIAGIGPAAADRADLLLDVGAHHPATHGSLRLALTLDDDEVVTACEPLVGHLHRGAEKLFEVRDYRAITMLANRHDWLSAYANEIGVVTAVERMLGLEVPERATWIRTLLVELNRILAHLLFLAAGPGSGPALDPGLVAARERVQALLEAATGGRMHFMASRVGGIAAELPAGWTGDARAVLASLPTPTAPEGLQGKGFLDPALVAPYGVSGPMARASGVGIDLRRDAPSLAYDRLEVPLVVQTGGDAAARYTQLVEEIAASRSLAEQCLEMLETVTGAVNVRLPKVVKAPEGAVYVRTENPLGVLGYYLVSRGERTPWRLHLRTASFNNVQVLRAMLPGTALADLAVVLASVFFVVGDIDK